MCFCVCSGYSARLRLWAVVQFIYCVFECVSVCIQHIFIYIKAAQPSRTAPGSDLLGTRLKLSSHTKGIRRLKK